MIGIEDWIDRSISDWLILSEVFRNFALGVVAAMGLYAAWRRMQAATRQADASLRQQQIANDALLQQIFAKAVDNLANESLSVRVGGILSLGGLGQAEDDYKETVIRVLTAYMDEHRSMTQDDTMRRDIAEAVVILAKLKTD